MHSEYLLSHLLIVCFLLFYSNVFIVPINSSVPKQPIITSFTCSAQNALITWKSQPFSAREYASRILYYVVQYQTSFSPNEWITDRGDINPMLTQHSIALSPWTNYTFRIIARNKNGGSQPSNPTKTCSTPASFPDKIVENVKGLPALNCGIIVTWSQLPTIDHNGPGFKYKVMWKPERTLNVWEMKVAEKWKNTVMIKNLKSSAWYLIRVISSNEIGDNNVFVSPVRAKSGNCNSEAEKSVVNDLEPESTLSHAEATNQGKNSYESYTNNNNTDPEVSPTISKNLNKTIENDTTVTESKPISTAGSESLEMNEETTNFVQEVFELYPTIYHVATEMDAVQLPCLKTGEFQPTILWTRNNKTLYNDHRFNINGKGDLEISEVHRHDAGQFRCHVSTSESGTTKISVISLTVLAKEIPGRGNYLFYVLVGGVFVIFTFCVAYIHQNRAMKKTRRLLQRMASTDIEVYLGGLKEGPFINDPEKINPLILPYDDTYEIPKEDLTVLDTIIGHGAYGIVFKGVLKQLGKKETVAVKTVDPGTETIFFKALISELKIMSYIGKHPNVISLIGCVTTNIKYRNLYLVLEYCENGNLESYLRNNRKSMICDQSVKKSYENIGQGVIITRSMLYKWALEIARGMNFLASKKIVHGDLATRNILLTSCCEAKITDFGLSKHLYKDSVYMKVEKIPVPWKWMSLEGLRYNIFSTESDMWSYGITLWEIFSLGQVPYPGDSGNCEFIKNILEGKRLSRPTYASEEIFNTMLLMWNIEPESRPTFKNVIPILEKELIGYNDYNYTVL